MSPRDDDDHILPTAALYAEAIPGVCCACEDNIVRREELELAERELENHLLTAELDRRKAKIKANDFSGATTTEPLRVELTNVASAPGRFDAVIHVDACGQWRGRRALLVEGAP